LFQGYYHDETIAQAQKKEGPTSSFSQQQPTSTKKVNESNLSQEPNYEQPFTPSNANFDSSSLQRGRVPS
jgi:hypothetical protein